MMDIKEMNEIIENQSDTIQKQSQMIDFLVSQTKDIIFKLNTLVTTDEHTQEDINEIVNSIEL